ncbi:MAG: hypothetical protein IT195_07070 [Microthrixaceae bacterium]|nr:hypothetical protein [Microthrixaceae bacterium]
MSLARRNAILLVAPALVVAIAWWFFVWGAGNAAVAAAVEQQDAVSMEVIGLGNAVSKAKKYESDPVAAADFARLRTALPERTDLSAFLLHNEEAARAAFVSIQAVTPDEVETELPSPDGLESTKVTITVVGEPSSVFDYVERVQTLARSTTIDRLEILRVEGTALEATLDIRIFEQR